MILLVTYDLHNPGRDYDAVSEVLQGARSYIHPQGSVWVLDTSRDPANWRDRLAEAGDSNDEYFVVRLRQNWASWKMSKAETDWLKDSARTW